MDLNEIAAVHQREIEKHERIGELLQKLSNLKKSEESVDSKMDSLVTGHRWYSLLTAVREIEPTHEVWLAAFQLLGLCSDSIKKELKEKYGVDVEPPQKLQDVDNSCTKATLKRSGNFQLRYPQIILQSTFYTELGLAIDSNVVQFNNVQDLPPVGCNILIKLPAGTPIMGALILDAPLILTAERTSHVDARGKDMHYALKDGTIIRGQFEWTYP